MSKSIFIIDTPACCGECPMSGTGVCRKWSLKEARTFPKDCPLKPAYDVEQVVKKVRELEICGKCLNNVNSVETCAEFCDVGKRLKIIKSGGIE